MSNVDIVEDGINRAYGILFGAMGGIQAQKKKVIKNERIITNEKVQPIVFILEGGNVKSEELLTVYKMIDILAQKNIGKIKCHVRFEFLDMSRYNCFARLYRSKYYGPFQGLVPVATPLSSHEDDKKNNFFSIVKSGMFESSHLVYYGDYGGGISCIDLDKYHFRGLGTDLLLNHDSMYDEGEKYFPETVQRAFRNQFGRLPLLSKNEVGLSFVFVSNNPQSFDGIDEFKRIIPSAKFYGFCKGGKENRALAAFTGDSNNVYDISQVDALANAILSNQVPPKKYVVVEEPKLELPMMADARYDNY